MTNPLNTLHISSEKLKSLRHQFAELNLQGYLLPHNNEFRNEQLPVWDERLAWLTGFTGSAGFAAISLNQAAVFVDGRYTLQASQQIVAELFQIKELSLDAIVNWLQSNLTSGSRVGVCGKHISVAEFDFISQGLKEKNVELIPTADYVAKIWSDRPSMSVDNMYLYPLKYAGESQEDKCHRLAEELKKRKIKTLVLTDSSSVSWLLNIRGNIIPQNTIVQSYAFLHHDASVDLFVDHTSFAMSDIANHLCDVRPHPVEAFASELNNLKGPIQFNPLSLCYQYYQALNSADAVRTKNDPVEKAKALKNPIQQQCIRACHIRDGSAMIEFLAWLDKQKPDSLTELEIVQSIRQFRQSHAEFRDDSFNAIVGSGPNGAIVHYRVNHKSNRQCNQTDLLLIDSGAHYIDGTTDITRTITLGHTTEQQRADYTMVLKALIRLSIANWPEGTKSMGLDAITRYHHWQNGKDYEHGTGHGVGQFMDVHESPYMISKRSETSIPANILTSIEPGYYRTGEYGIRLENLALSKEVESTNHCSGLNFIQFETITFVPFDNRMIDPSKMEKSEIAWLNSYHAKVLEIYHPNISQRAQNWLVRSCEPL